MKNYFRYIRGNHGKGLGAVMVSEFPNGEFKIGVSICNPNDEFSKAEAHRVAEDNQANSNIYSFYEIIDGDWYADIVDSLPARIEYDVVATIWEIADDITMDYARSHYKSIMS